MASYNSEALTKYAGQLLREAIWVRMSYGLIGLLAGTAAAAAADLGLRQMKVENAGLFALAVFIIGLFWGIASGGRKALLLKVQAQTILCQVQIEQNTRPDLKPVHSDVPIPNESDHSAK